MGVVIFLLICCVVVLLGLCIKWNTEKYTEDITEIKTEEVKEFSIDTGTIVIDYYKPFPKSNCINSNDYSKYSKQYIQSILNLLLYIQTNPTKYTCVIDCKNIHVYDVYRLIYDSPIEDISIEVLTLLKLKNLISIQQMYIPTKYDNYGFVESYLRYKIIIKVTEEGKKYLNS